MPKTKHTVVSIFNKKYNILKSLGEGHTSKVYLAQEIENPPQAGVNHGPFFLLVWTVSGAPGGPGGLEVIPKGYFPSLKHMHEHSLITFVDWAKLFFL